MLRHVLAFLLLLFCCIPKIWAQGDPGQLLDEVSLAMAEAKTLDEQKIRHIEKLRSSVVQKSGPDASSLYQAYLQLYEEYKTFQFDSAFSYAGKLASIAKTQNNPSKIAESGTKTFFVLLSAGMFKEAAETMQQIETKSLPENIKAEFFYLKARFYFDLGDYNVDRYFTPVYSKQGIEYLDSASALYQADSFERLYLEGLKQIKTEHHNQALLSFQKIVNRKDLTYHQVALVASTLSYVYHIRGNKAEAVAWQARAAIADIRSSTKETFAIFNLAQMLFEDGDFSRASSFIKKAVADAEFYGARQRKVQISTLMPIIQSSEINYIEGQRRKWVTYAAVVSGILVLLVFLFLTIYQQYKKLEVAKNTISEAHNKLHLTNTRLEKVNEALQAVNTELNDVNGRLQEANKIKEEYIGYFFTINSWFFQKMERLKKSIGQKVQERKLEDIRFIINNVDVDRERKDLLATFDKAFLKLFPHFLGEFNKLLHEEEQIKLPEGDLLNTDLRIYALVRLGIKDNEKIAEILEYSVKSIYAYKSKIRSRAKLPKDEFEQEVMKIKSV